MNEYRSNRNLDGISTPLGAKMRDKFDETSKARAQSVEERWLKSLRQYKGIYEPTIKLHPKRAKAFLRVTRLKVDTLTRLMMTGMFGNKEKNWTLKPTPIPTLDQQTLTSLIKDLIMQNGGKRPTDDVILDAVRVMADSSAEKMERTIMDQLAESQVGGYESVIRKCVKSGNLFGTGILKGPLVRREEKKQWAPDQSGKWNYETVRRPSGPGVSPQGMPPTGPVRPPAPPQGPGAGFVPGGAFNAPQNAPQGMPQGMPPQAAPEMPGQPPVAPPPQDQPVIEKKPYIECVPVWDIYPDMSATSLEDAQFIFQRSVMTKKDLLDLAKRVDFDGERLMNYIKEMPNGDADDWETFEQELNSMGGDRDSNPQRSRKYEFLEYWGLLSSEELEEAGATIPEELKGLDVWANVCVVGDVVVKAKMNPLKASTMPFYFYYYQKDETSIFGEGVPDIIRDIQDVLNSAIRLLIDNAAHSSGPIYEVNPYMLQSGEDPLDISPYRVFLRADDAMNADKKSVHIHEIPSQISDAISIIQLCEKYLDDTSGIPRFDHADSDLGGAGETAAGLSMLMNRSNASISEQIKEFEEAVIIRLITALYHWNMQFGSARDAKGDMSVVVGGAQVVQAKEARVNTLMTFRAQIGNDPALMALVKWPEFLRVVADNAEIPESVICSEKEYEQIQNQQQQEMAAAQANEAMKQFIAESKRLQMTPGEVLLDLAMRAGLVVDPKKAQQLEQQTKPLEQVRQMGMQNGQG